MVSHYRREREQGREQAEKMEARRASTPSSRLQRGNGQSSLGPSRQQTAGIGDEPQVARARQGTRRCPALPHPHPKL